MTGGAAGPIVHQSGADRPLSGWTARRIWPIALFACVAVQITVTMLVRDQQWSMAAGLSCIILCCAAIVARSAPATGVDQWRWRLAAIGFVLWAMLFLFHAFESRVLDTIEPYCAALKQLIFIAILVPSHAQENERIFRAIDTLQGALVAFCIALLTWGSLFNIAILGVDPHYVSKAYFVMAALAAISYFSQQDASNRQFVLNIAILHVGYAIVSYSSVYIDHYYSLGINSPAWVIGDVIFVIYGIRISRANMLSASAMAVEDHGDDGVFEYRRHLPPVFLAVLLLILTFQIGTQNCALGMALGVLGLLGYATRTTILLDRYLMTRDKLIVAERMHARLLIDMIHEIRSPLGSMVLNAGMLERTARLSDQQAAWVEQIGLGGARVTAMLNDVLEIERIDAGLIGAQASMCDVQGAIDAAVGVVAVQAAAAGIAIDVGGDLACDVVADRRMLERVLINLLTNAVRFTPQGGRIRVVVADGGLDRVLVRVEDDGVGIAPDLVATLFDRFAHIGIPIRGHRGSGLGLSICRGLMTAMGGDITIESRPNEGTVAIVGIPSGRRFLAAGHDG